VDILPIILFFLGAGFLFMGWRWQNPPNEEALTALKGLAYLKREIIRVQDQVYDLEGKLLEFREKNIQVVEHREVMSNEKETNVVEFNPEEHEYKHIQSKDICSLNLNNTQKKIKQGVEPQPRLSPKYLEVLELAANGQRIPEIAQRLFLSQDAVKMVLSMQPNGGSNS